MNNQESNTIRMTCQECGGTMDIDKDKTILCCPYCGSKKLIIESDAVRIERIKAEHETELQKNAYEQVNKQQKSFVKGMIGYFIGLIIFLGLGLLLCTIFKIQ